MGPRRHLWVQQGASRKDFVAAVEAEVRAPGELGEGNVGPTSAWEALCGCLARAARPLV